MSGVIFEVFSAVGTWLVSMLNTIVGLFYTAGANGAAGSLTFFGEISLIALGISVIFLIIRVVQNFLHFRG